MLRVVLDSAAHHAQVDEIVTDRWRRACDERRKLCTHLKLLGNITETVWDGPLRLKWGALTTKLGLTLRSAMQPVFCSSALRSAVAALRFPSDPVALPTPSLYRPPALERMYSDWGLLCTREVALAPGCTSVRADGGDCHEHKYVSWPASRCTWN